MNGRQSVAFIEIPMKVCSRRARLLFANTNIFLEWEKGT